MMPQRFVACDREQSFLMPPDVREWLSPGHLAWFVTRERKSRQFGVRVSAGQIAWEGALLARLCCRAGADAGRYVKNRGLSKLLAARAIVHKRTRPYTPGTNGKVERYQQTLGREWEKGLTYNTSADHRAALPHWLEHYNTRRRHSGIANVPPLTAFTTSSGRTPRRTRVGPLTPIEPAHRRI